MKFSRSLIAVWLLSVAAAARPAEPPSVPILPKEFGGWQIKSEARASKDPGVADPVNAMVLKEYGFTDFESGNYIRDDGRKLGLRAARFQDASGAYGAFTFYKQPEMLNEKIGDQASSLNTRILFYRGNVLVDAVFDQLSVMSAAELRELAADLPLPAQGARSLPSLPTYLPKQSYVKNSAKYVMGPVTLDKLDSPLPATLVGFGAGAEAVLGRYNASGGEASLMLISYPTPQIAAERMRAIEAAYRQDTPQQPGTPTLVDKGPIFDKRTGPIVVVASGPLSQSEGKSLLAAVNYDANVTWNENTSFTKKDNLANLLVNIIILCAILIGFALVVGLAFGGVRVLFQRLFPQRALRHQQDVEFISLHMSEGIYEPPLQR